MKPLLQEIADYYITRYKNEITDFCFVFPNKRAGVFFNHFLAEAAEREKHPLIHPEVLTISDFVAEMIQLVEATRIEQLLILYRCYCDIVSESIDVDSKSEPVDFN